MNAVEEIKAQEGDEIPETPLTTGQMMDLLKDLWSDDKCVIGNALTEIADLGRRDDDENEIKMRELGGHIAVFQLVQKHVGCLEIEEEGMRALGNFCRLMPTKTLLGDIGCVEVILARMEKDRDERIQLLGCTAIASLVRAKGNTERVEKSGGIAVLVAAMRAHRNCEMVQSRGCRALSNMSEWEEYRPLIMKAGGASAIASAMENYWDHPKLRERASKALEKLVKKPR